MTSILSVTEFKFLVNELFVLEQPYLAVTVLFYQQFSTIFQTLRKMIKFVFKQIFI